VRLATARTELEAAQTEVCSTQSELKKLEPWLSFSPKLDRAAADPQGSGHLVDGATALSRCAKVDEIGDELDMPELGHRKETRSVLFPRMIEALAGKKVIALTPQPGLRRGNSLHLGLDNMGS